MITETQLKTQVEVPAPVREDRQVLTNVLYGYYHESLDLREYHEDTSNLDFHTRFGFSMQVPEHWDIMSSLSELINIVQEDSSKRILVIYSHSRRYKEAYDSVGESVSYISWHEIHTAMQISNSDPSYMRRMRALLGDADLTLLLDPPLTLPDVVNQIRLETGGCLIAIGSRP